MSHERKSGPLLQPQSTAPDFRGEGFLHGKEEREISLKDFKGQYVILLFFPMDETRVCSFTEAKSISSVLEKFRANKCAVIGIVPQEKDKVDSLMKTPFEEGGLGGTTFTIIADPSKDICHQYKLQQGGTLYRGVFVVDKERRIRFSAIYHHHIGRSLKEIIRLVQEFTMTEQIAAKEPEVEPEPEPEPEAEESSQLDIDELDVSE